MGAFSWVHIAILAAIALVLFGGRGKVSDLMGDFGKGINSFKKGLTEKDDPKVINADTKEKDKTTVSSRVFLGPCFFPDRAGAS
jgi:sec-independent protein translocase protein TatA